jgi:hypothetical protein
MRYALALLLFCSMLASAQAAANKPEEPNFPTTEEIQLVTGQAERAFSMYKELLNRQETLGLAALSGKESLARERKLIELSGTLLSALKADPNKFHGLGSLLLLSGLDDASRNAALCSGQGMAKAFAGLIDKQDDKKAHELLHVAQSCADLSAHLYTVSESVHALLVREIEGQQLLGDRAVEVINKCMANANLAPKQKP